MWSALWRSRVSNETRPIISIMFMKKITMTTEEDDAIVIDVHPL